MSLVLGVFTAGEVPAPLSFIFQDSTGAAINLAGYDAKFAFNVRSGTATIRTATVTNAAAGEVTYTWQGSDMAAGGVYTGEFIVDDGANRYSSDPIQWRVRSAVAAVTFP